MRCVCGTPKSRNDLYAILSDCNSFSALRHKGKIDAICANNSQNAEIGGFARRRRANDVQVGYFCPSPRKVPKRGNAAHFGPLSEKNAVTFDILPVRADRKRAGIRRSAALWDGNIEQNARFVKNAALEFRFQE
jgi:hypothetical protein